MELLQTIELEKKYLAVRIDRRLAATLIINAIQKGQDVSIAITALLTEDHTSIVLPLPTTHTMDDVKALLLTFLLEIEALYSRKVAEQQAKVYQLEQQAAAAGIE